MSRREQLPPKYRVPEPLLSREAHLNPYPWFSEMRDREPVFFDDRRGVWDLFTAEHVEAVITDYETFNRDPSDEIFANALTYVEPPTHTRLRDAVEEFFRPGTLREMEPALEESAAALLDDALADGDRFDFATEFAIPFPVIVIAELLGVPPSKRDTFREWSKALVASPASTAEADAVQTDEHRKEAAAELETYLRDVVARRTEDPRDDLISALVHEKADQLSHEEIVSISFHLLMAGNVTTTNLISNAVWMLAEQGYYRDVRAGTVSKKTAIEEVLRYWSPVKGIIRVAREDAAVGGREITEGDPILAWLGSANRDEAKFDDPDVFNPERTPNRHLGFGKGIHYCLGAPLAKLETEIALSALFDRAEAVDVSRDEMEPFYSGSLNGPKSFPVTVTPP